MTSAPSAKAAAPAERSPVRPSLPIRLLDAWLDRWYAFTAGEWFQRVAPRLPITGFVARYRSRKLFDIVAGFVYSKTLSAAVELGLLDLLAKGPLPADEVARQLELPLDSAERLLRACHALDLIRFQGGRYGVGRLGAMLVNNQWLTAFVQHHEMAYRDLDSPVRLLRHDATYRTELSKYWAYADHGRLEGLAAEHVSPYSEVMALTLPPVARDALDAYDLSRHRRLLDVGGGEGVFLEAAGQRHPDLELMLFDLPAVADLATARLTAAGMRDRATCIGGNFHTDPLPTGADVISLVRVVLDHDDVMVLALLRRVYAALPVNGRLLVIETISGASGAETAGDAFFNFYLLAMGRGRARRAGEHEALLREAGFQRIRHVATQYPIQTGLIVAEK
jgi:demethylspheroidene O-methyltransferase